MQNNTHELTPSATRTIEGIPFTIDGDEPRARDVDLAVRLHYPRPRKIRELIVRHAADLGFLDVRPTVGRTSMPNGGSREVVVNEYWLTEEQALFIAAKSDTGQATKLLKGVIRVFMLARRGLLPSQIAPQGLTTADLATALAPIAAGFEALTKMMVAMNDRLTAVEDRQRDGQILARERVNAIKRRVASCALDLGKYGVEKRRAASLRIHKRLKMAVGWFGDYCRLDNMPARHEADVLRALEIVEHETKGAVAAAQQLRFPTLALVGNNNAKRTSA